MPFTSITATYFLGIAGFGGAFVSFLTVPYLSRRMVLIGGHAFIMLFCVLIAVFIDINVYFFS